MGQANVPWEWDYLMCPWNVYPENGTSQCALGMGPNGNVPWEWD